MKHGMTKSRKQTFCYKSNFGESVIDALVESIDRWWGCNLLNSTVIIIPT